MRLLSIFSLMKCPSTSTCLVRLCWTGLCAMFMVALLLQYSLIGSSLSTCNVFSRVLIYMSSQIPRAIAWYSALTLDLATIGCFLLLQVTKLPYKGAIPWSRSLVSYWSNIISISVSFYLHVIVFREWQTNARSGLQISQYPHDRF